MKDLLKRIEHCMQKPYIGICKKCGLCENRDCIITCKPLFEEAYNKLKQYENIVFADVSMYAEQVKRIKGLADAYERAPVGREIIGTVGVLREAADTIELLTNCFTEE